MQEAREKRHVVRGLLHGPEMTGLHFSGRTVWKINICDRESSSSQSGNEVESISHRVTSKTSNKGQEGCPLSLFFAQRLVFNGKLNHHLSCSKKEVSGEKEEVW